MSKKYCKYKLRVLMGICNFHSTCKHNYIINQEDIDDETFKYCPACGKEIKKPKWLKGER